MRVHLHVQKNPSQKHPAQVKIPHNKRFCYSRGYEIMENKRKYVIPGDVITTGPYRPEQNVILDGNKIISTAIGISEIYDDSIKVIPLTGKYIPKIDDLVIGKIISHTSLSWELDINSCYVGFLPAQDVFGRDFSAHADELSSKLKSGDLVARSEEHTSELQ